jgi:hypothetical protein
MQPKGFRMKPIDIAFGITLLAFGLGSAAGAMLTAFSPTFREILLLLINFRVIFPMRAATPFGEAVVMLLIFSNNCVPIALSFLYPLILGKVRWTPPIQRPTEYRLLMGFSLLAGGLLGFFNLGAPLMLVAELRGPTLLNRLLASSWVHAPLEFLFVLACVAEPLRLARNTRVVDRGIVRLLRTDLGLLLICLIGLLASAAIEVFAGL